MEVEVMVVLVELLLLVTTSNLMEVLVGLVVSLVPLVI
jgi:hypothetical protein